MLKRFIIAIVLLILVGGGLVGFNLFRAKAIQDFFANMELPTMTVSATAVEPVTWTPTIDAVGTISAAQGIAVAVEASGIIREVNFNANDRISQGQLLVQIEDRVERADLAAAEAQLESDRQTLERTRTLRERGVNAAVTLENAQTAVTASEAQVARLNAVLEQRAVEAPFAGTIGIPRVEVGDFVTAGTVIATLQDLSYMRVDFTVPEQNFNRLTMGQTVRIADALSGQNLEGTIVGIDPKIDPMTRLISVRAEIENADGALQPGQFARVAIELPPEDGVLALPQTAVVTSLYGDFVYLVVPRKDQEDAAEADTEADAEADAETQADAGNESEAEAPADGAQPPPATLEVRQAFVTTGRRSGAIVEILSGIEAGQQVVTAGQNRLSNGTPVRIDNTVDPARLAQERAATP